MCETNSFGPINTSLSLSFSINVVVVIKWSCQYSRMIMLSQFVFVSATIVACHNFSSCSNTSNDALLLAGDQTPKQVVFESLRPQKTCFACGRERPDRHSRLLNNITMKGIYRQLVKEVFPIQLPKDSIYISQKLSVLRLEYQSLFQNSCFVNNSVIFMRLKEV